MSRDTDNHPTIVERGTALSILATYRTWLEQIPQEADTTTTVEVLQRIAAVTEPGQLTPELPTRAAEKALNRVLIIDDVTRRPSGYESGFGWYLVCSCHTEASGEVFSFSTGARRPVAMLVKAHHEGWLPLKAMLSRSEKPTKGGFKPFNLTVYGHAGDF